MTELSAIEAKEAAVREVAKLLPLPENLASIAALKADFAQRQQANDAQLSTSVMTQVEQAKAGMDVLAASQATIGELRDAFMLIDKLCTECKNLIDHHDQINLLSHARNNLNTAIKDAEGMMSISEEAAAARASLANEKELVRTFERLNVLEGKRRFALAATGSRKAEASRLTEYFEEVSQTREMFEQTLWGHIRDFFNLAQESPQTLVRCAKIVEMQEVIDAEAAREAAEAEKASAAGGDPPGTTAPPKQPRNYKTRCFSELEHGVEDHFHDLLNNFIHEDLKKVLDEASAIASELPDIYDYVAPCFPPQYEIFVFMVQLYTQHFSAMLRKLGDRAQDLANIDILKVMGWIARYQEQLLALGVEESKAEILAECGAMDPLMNAYVDRMQDSMQSWFRNILEDDWAREPKFSEEGRAWTPSAVDFFRLLGEQVATVQNNCTGVMVYKVAQAVIQVMNDFQAAQRAHMELPVMEIGLEHLCALVNNNVRCYDLAKDLSENIMHSLPDYYAEQIHFEDTCRNFLDIAKDAVHLTLKLIFEDPGVKSILQALYQNDWYQGLVTETLIETFRDYFGDIEKFIEERSFRRFAEACLERTIVAYVDALLLQKNYVKEATLERMGKDEYQINDFFKVYVNEKKVEKRVQPLADLRELIMSDSPESFELNYTTLLQNHPDCPPEVVAKLVGFREDIAKADKKEVIARCQEIFQGMLKDGEGPKPGLIFSHLTAIPRPKLTLKK